MAKKIIFIILLSIGAIALLGYLIEAMDLSHSTDWPTALGKLDGFEDRPLNIPFLGNFPLLVIPHGSYTYTVDRKQYHGERNSGPLFLPVRMCLFKGPAIVDRDGDQILTDELKPIGDATVAQEIIKKEQAIEKDLLLHPNYKPVKVRYNERNPEQSMLDPDVMQAPRCQMITAAILIVLGGVGVISIIVHANLTAPALNDPTLSVEAALAAQRRRKPSP